MRQTTRSPASLEAPPEPFGPAAGPQAGPAVFLWPRSPELPPPCRPALVRVPTLAPRPAARLELRAVLRQILARWTGLPPSALPLSETPQGPAWQGLFGARRLDISLSYAAGEGWIGLVLGAFIGVDVMRVASLPDIAEIARCYLGPLAAQALRPVEPADRPAAFAAAWTEREARLKCLKRGLAEWSPSEARIEAACAAWKFACGRLVGAVALAPSGRWRAPEALAAARRIG